MPVIPNDAFDPFRIAILFEGEEKRYDPYDTHRYPYLKTVGAKIGVRGSGTEHQ